MGHGLLELRGRRQLDHFDTARIGSSDATLRYVVAHELCHAMDDMALGLSSELGADLCAALHGAPRP